MSMLRTFFKRDRDPDPRDSQKGFEFIERSQSHRLSDAANIERTTKAAQVAMQTNELVYACLKVKADAALDPRLIVQNRKRNKEWIEAEGHPLRQLMAQPNPYMTEADMHAAAIISWDTTNPRRFYCEKVYRGAYLAELWPLNPLYVFEEKLAAGRVQYRYDDGEHMAIIQQENMLVRKAPAWYKPSPTAAAMGSIKGDMSQTAIINNFFKNGGVPSGILKVKGFLSEGQADQTRDRWRSRQSIDVGGPQIAVLDDNADYQAVGVDLDQLSSQQMRMVAESRICMAFGVPPLIVYAYVGLLRSTYSNLKEAWSSFWDSTMSPQMKEWRMFWQMALLSEYETEDDIRRERVRVFWDFSDVSALQDDVDAIQKRITDKYNAGLITLNEAREALGETPLPNGDLLKGQSNAGTELQAPAAADQQG